MTTMNDADLIDALGGPTALAGRLGYTDPGGVQRVSNWKRRGIPPRVRLEHQPLFSEVELIGTEGAPDIPAAQEAA